MPSGHARVTYAISLDATVIEYYAVMNDGALAKRTMAELNADEFSTLPVYKYYFDIQTPNRLPSQAAVNALAASMVSTVPIGAGQLPAGYTYLTQFIFHDLTWLSEQGGGVKNKASSALDMDSVLGKPFAPPDPGCPASPDVLRVGMTHPGWGSVPAVEGDIPRKPRCVVASSADLYPSGFPVIPDLRNEGFLQLAQMHVAFLKFYNAVALAHGFGGTFDEAGAKQDYIQHVQSVVLYDLLEKLLDPAIYADVIQGNHRRFIHPGAITEADPFLIPMEFAAAAARFGHSMVRDTYDWNAEHDATHQADLGALITNSYQNATPSSIPMLKLDRDWVIDWYRFFDFRPLLGTAFPAPQLANSIGPRIAETMGMLPTHIRPVASGDVPPPPGSTFNVAQATLTRQVQFQMASAQHAIDIMNLQLGPMQIQKLPYAVLAGPGGPTASAFAMYSDLAEMTPIWFYVLREAEFVHAGARLGPFGSRLVGETLHAAAETAGPDSLVANPGWTPTLPCPSGTFTMTDLLDYAFT